MAGKESRGTCDQVSAKRSELKFETGAIAVSISTHRLSGSDPMFQLIKLCDNQ